MPVAFWGRYLAAVIASACLANLAVPPYDFWPMALVCWVPLLFILRRARTSEAVLFGLVQGALTHVIGFRWVARALHEEMSLSWTSAVLALVAFAILQGGRSALIALFASRAQTRGWPLFVLFAPSLVTAELSYPMFIPWYAALFVHDAPSLFQLAEIGGPLLVSAWLALANAGFWMAFERWRVGQRGGAVRAAGFTALGVALIAALGLVRMRDVRATTRESPAARVAVVQGAIQDDDLRDPLDVYRESTLRLLETEPNVELVVWPETAISTPVSMDTSRSAEHFFREVVFRDSRLGLRAPPISVPLLTGIVLERPSTSGASDLLNAAVLVDRTGQRLGTYIKRELAPIGEATPMGEWIPGLESLFPPKTKFSRAESEDAIEFDSRRIGVSICYEDILPGSVRASVNRARPHLLINLTSDRWFADSPAADLHLALAKFRAVEHRRQLLRVTHDGVTARVEPTGEITLRLPRFRPEAAVTGVHWLSGSTVFGHLGDGPWWLLAAFTLVASSRRLSRTPPPSQRPSDTRSS